VDAVAESYVGYPDMINLMLQWHALSGAGVEAGEVEEAVSASKRKRRDNQAAAFYLETRRELALAKSRGLVVKHLKSLVLKKFDPVRAKVLLSRDNIDTAPKFVENLIAHEEWRSMLYELAEVHRDSLMLNYAITAMIASGFKSEVQVVTGATTAFFGVFTGILGDHMLRLASSHDGTWPETVRDIAALGSLAEHTFAYVLLASRAAHECGGPEMRSFRRIAEEVLMAVAEREDMAGLPTALSLALLPGPADASAKAKDCVNRMLLKGSTNSADVAELYNICSQAAGPDAAPAAGAASGPAALLRDIRLVRLLIADLFTPSRRTIATDFRAKYAYLLALAATAGAPAAPVGQKSLLERTQAAIVELSEVTRSRYGIREDEEAHLDTIYRILAYPVACMALLHWIKEHVADSEFYSTSMYTSCNPVYFSIFVEVSERHPLLRPLVLQTLSSYFVSFGQGAVESFGAIEVKRNMIDVMVHLVRLGLVSSVMSFVASWAGGEDHSLVRYFVTRVLSFATPVYSPVFIRAMVEILQATGSRDTFTSVEQTKRAVSTFVQQARETGETIPKAVLDLE
jgi:hypothetical protein